MLNAKKLMLVLSLVQFCFLFDVSVAVAQENWANEAAKLSQEYGIEIIFDDIAFAQYFIAKPELMKSRGSTNSKIAEKKSLLHWPPCKNSHHRKLLMPLPGEGSKDREENVRKN